MSNFLSALNSIVSFVNSFSTTVVSYSGVISGMVARLSNFATVSDSYVYLVVQFVPAPIWGVFVFELCFGSVKLLLSGVKDIKMLIKWW